MTDIKQKQLSVDEIRNMFPKSVVHGPARPKTFNQPSRLAESVNDKLVHQTISNLGNRISKMEKQLKIITNNYNRMEKANNYLKERILTLTNKVSGIEDKIKPRR